MATSLQLYQQKSDFMGSVYPELTASEFYREIFPLSDMEKKGDMEHRASNPIFSYKERTADGRVYFRNEIVFSDHFEESIAKTQKNDLALCSMISYSGRRKSAKNAFKCHGFIIDLDGVGMDELRSFWGWVEQLERIPYPSYVANSGHGLHIYYLFQNPVPLYPRVVEHLQNLKRGLTLWVWNKETSSYSVKDRQFQGIYQSFRMVGSKTKLGKGKAKNKYLVKVWKTGRPVSISYLNQFVEDEYKCPENPDYASWDWASEEHKSLSECAELYPDWYLRRIINKEPSGQWKCNRALYDWWLAKIQTDGNAKDGNRYHCISMLYVYGIKCMIAKELIDADAMELLEPFNELTTREDNKFEVADIKSASKFYDPKFAKMSRKEIERRTGIQIKGARRNGRSQEEHLKRARKLREDDYSMVGRPDVYSKVADWRKEHPDGTIKECIEDTKLSKSSVYKWWAGKPENKPAEKPKTKYASNSLEVEMQEAGLTDEQIKRMLAYIQQMPNN